MLLLWHTKQVQASTAKVRVTIPGSTQSGATHEVTIFYGDVVIQRVSGNSQVKNVGSGGLNSPLEVRVVDSGANNRGGFRTDGYVYNCYSIQSYWLPINIWKRECN